MLEYEEQLWDEQIQYIAGIDEAGRGCLLGDVVAAAVILPKGHVMEGIRDSKQLSEAKREEWYDRIHQEALAVGIGRVDAKTIDRINIRQASRLAMKKAVEQLSVVPEHLLIDAENIDLPIPQISIIKGDRRSQSVAAASIIAKVTRDRMCREWDLRYPEYGIASHKGYATKAHRECIRRFGPTDLHRQSFLKNILAVQQKWFESDI